MPLPFKNGEELAQALGFGELYRAAQENEVEGTEVAENVKKLMKRVNEAGDMRNKKDYFD